ncbi:MAG: 4Fe-4S dicluster domain-containing protein [Propionibacteriaceae bacterium]|jgi:Na+-translocating ferredoxin:NAD+ oxidoreductase RnfC subunit|nr:4Fe-4S dicluster domain-containing protein [Propionibacteriaceae bacterium]
MSAWTKDTLVDKVFSAGVVGAGGAGFPTHKKLADGVEMLVVNAVECEPLLASDRYVMRQFPGEIVEGIAAVLDALSIPRAVIGVKRHNTEEVAALHDAIAASGRAPITLHELDSFYPAGDEQILIYEITGRTVPPGGIPLNLGIVVINVTTALAIAHALRDEPMTRRYITVNGAVAEPVIVDAPVGATPADLIAAAGGATIDEFQLVRGGPLMGRQSPGSTAADFGYGKADGGLLVLPLDNPVVTLLAKPKARVVAEAKSICIQCSLCTEMCPRYLIGHQMRPHRVMRSVAVPGHSEDLLDALLCVECGVCELFACPMGLSPRQMNILAKNELRAAGIRTGDTTIHPEYTALRDNRRIAQSRFIERLHLDDYPAKVIRVVTCEPDLVRIPVRHGVGRPSTPVVAEGETVRAGQVIAEVARDDVGSLVHASIDGVVTAVGPEHIVVERR